jgi:hypothetical protein
MHSLYVLIELVFNKMFTKEHFDFSNRYTPLAAIIIELITLGMRIK